MWNDSVALGHQVLRLKAKMVGTVVHDAVAQTKSFRWRPGGEGTPMHQARQHATGTISSFTVFPGCLTARSCLKMRPLPAGDIRRPGDLCGEVQVGAGQRLPGGGILDGGLD